MEDQHLLTVPAIEMLFGVSRYRLYKLIQDGEIPHVRLGRKRIYVKRHDWETYLENAEHR
jgi:excisionase family DNA binding protein